MDPPAYTRAREKEASLKKITEEKELKLLTLREAMKLELIKSPTQDD
jgi:hypothetical protein